MVMPTLTQSAQKEKQKDLRHRLLDFLAEESHSSPEVAAELRREIEEAKWENAEEHKPLLPLTGKPNSRERMLAAMAKITPISQETADMIDNAIQEAREQSIADSLSS